jgi:hypothetical protein
MKTVNIFGTTYPVIAEFSLGWSLIAHCNGPALANEAENMISSLFGEQVPSFISESGFDALRNWCISQPTWPTLPRGER